MTGHVVVRFFFMWFRIVQLGALLSANTRQLIKTFLYDSMPLSRSRGEMRLFQIVSLIGLLFFFFLSPERFGFSVCPVYNATGYPCPGCGITRSASRFFHLHFMDSIRWHPFGPAVVAGMLLFGLSAISNGVYGFLLRYRKLATGIVIFFASVSTVYGVIRILTLLYFPDQYDVTFNRFEEPPLFRLFISEILDSLLTK